MVVLSANNITILDDTYNANPESVAAAIRDARQGRRPQGRGARRYV